MQIVIDIPYGHYLTIKDGFLNECIKSTTEAIVNGKILPKGHGRLIDADELIRQYNLDEATKYGNKDAKQQAHSYSTMMLYEIADMIDDAPTIIEADKGDKE